MCAASRALATLLVACLVAAPAWAQAPGNPEGPAAAGPVPSAEVAPPAVPPAGEPPAPGFTPGAEPPFTAAPPSPPTAPPPAAPAPPPSPSAAPAPAPAPPPETPAEASAAARAADAHLDRVVLLPTAETHPAGTVYFSSYEIVALQAGYALSDRTQLTLTFVPPLTKDPLVPLDLTLKGVITRTPRVRVAALASVSGLFGYDGGNAAVGRVGGVTQLCFDDACRSSVNMAVDVGLVGPISIVADGIGAVLRANRVVSFLVEVQSVLPIGRQGAEIHALAGAMGLRLSGKHWAGDLALEGLVDRKTKPQAIPVLVLTYRFGT